MNERVPDASERLFQDAVMKIAYMNAWDVHHIRPGKYGNYYKTDGLPGMPDLLFISQFGHGMFWAELKAQGGRLTESQRARIDQMRVNGAEVHIWKPSDMQTIADRLGAWRKR